MIKAGKLKMHSSCRTGAVMATIMTVSLSLGACSWTPDWANPVEWYKGTRDWVSGDDPQNTAQAAKPVPGADKPYPKLSSVPQRPAAPSEAQRKAMAKSLAADRKSARYTDGQIRRQSESVTRADIAPPAAPRIATPRIATPQIATPTVRARPSPVQSARRAPATPSPRPPRVPAVPPASATIAMAPSPLPAISSPLPSMPATMPNSRRIASLAPPARGGFVPAKRFSTRFPAGVGGQITPPAGTVSGLAGALGTVYFKSGSSRVTAAERRKIRRAVELVKGRGGRLVVVGHASSRTRDLDPLRHHLANFRISYDRAEAVAKELVRQGVARNLIEINAMSDSRPVFHEVMPAGEALNRRVEIVLAN
jgi:outer membrane protein OmpA-like peptidoglycan-associated protein